MNASETLDRIAAADNRIEYYPVKRGDLKFNSARTMEYRGDVGWRIGDDCYDMLRNRLGIPAGYEKRLSRKLCSQIHQELFDAALLADSRQNSPGRMSLAVRDGAIVGIQDTRLLSLSNNDVVTSVQNVMREGSDVADVHRVQLSDSGSFLLQITTPLNRGEPRTGDFVDVGISISHSPLGDRATRVDAFIHRLVCSNGMMVPVYLDRLPNTRSRKRIRRLDAENFRTSDLISQLDRSLNDAWQQSQEALAALQQLANLPVDFPVEDLLRQFAKDHRFSKNVINDLLEALQLDEMGPAEGTVFDIVMALSRLGTHGSNDESRSISPTVLQRLQILAGTLLDGRQVERCPHCKRLMRQTMPSPSRN